VSRSSYRAGLNNLSDVLAARNNFWVRLGNCKYLTNSACWRNAYLLLKLLPVNCVSLSSAGLLSPG
jgi:hypothetical protein